MPPDGRFTIKKKRAIHRVGFAAGSGITPILSIAATTLEEQPDAKFTLVYGNRRMSSVMFNEACRTSRTATRPPDHDPRAVAPGAGSRPAAGPHRRPKVRDIIDALLPVGSMDEVFICGPEAMIEATEPGTDRGRRARNRVYTERFTVNRSGQAAKVRPTPTPPPSSRPPPRTSQHDRGARRQAARDRDRAETSTCSTPRSTPASTCPSRARPACAAPAAPRCRGRGGDGQELHPRSRRNGAGLSCSAARRAPPDKQLTLSFDDR
jgi:ferredoxin-NADP reductase